MIKKLTKIISVYDGHCKNKQNIFDLFQSKFFNLIYQLFEYDAILYEINNFIKHHKLQFDLKSTK